MKQFSEQFVKSYKESWKIFLFLSFTIRRQSFKVNKDGNDCRKKTQATKNQIRGIRLC